MFSDHTFYEIFKMIPVLGSGKLYQEVFVDEQGISVAWRL